MAQSVFEKSVFWNNGTGVTLPYSESLVLRSVRIIRPFSAADGTGVDGNMVTRDITYEDLTVVGYHRGIDVPRAGYSIIRGGYFNNEQNIIVRMAGSPGRLVHVTGDIRFGEFPPEVLGRRTQYEIYLRSALEVNMWGLSHVFAKSSVTLNYGRFSNTPVYFHSQRADYVPFSEPQQGIPLKYVGLTNQQLYDRFGVRISGEFAPADGESAPRVLGLVQPVR